MRFSFQGDISAFEEGIRLIIPYLDDGSWQIEYTVEVKKSDCFVVGRDNGLMWIHYQNRVQFFRGLGLLVQNIKNKKSNFIIKEKPVFTNLAASFDMSRNSVLNIATVKDLLCKMSLMGFQQAMLYTEDTYEIEGYPYFGYLRGKYTKEQLKELDSFADSLGIELVPCIQTLGHLERFLHWSDSAEYRDTNDVLLVGYEKSYELIENMIATVRECYKTQKIHVGMDEAMNLGLGGYLRDNGYENGFSIMQKHITRVSEIAQKYEFVPMMWSDMYFRCASKTHDYYEEAIEIPQEVIEKAPEHVELVYWDYYHDNKEFYDHYIKLHHRFRTKTWFAGGMWTWLGPAIDYNVFFKTSLPALEACVENGVTDVIITTWGDDGGETNINSMLLGLQVYAEYCYKGKFNEKEFFSRFSYCTKGNPQAMCRISEFNKSKLVSEVSDLPNAAKFILYQDPLVGLYDKDIENLGFEAHYEQLEKEFLHYYQNETEYKLLYLFYNKLAAALKWKAELGIKIKTAYKEKCIEKLQALATQAGQAADAYEELKQVWEKLWMSTNKPFGFEIIDVRISGAKGRLQSCQKRIESYCNGEIHSIEELEEERICILRKDGTNILNGVYFWKDIVSSGRAF